jgi:hypothetical protein
VTGTGCVGPALTAVVGDVVAAAIEFLTLENNAVTRVYDDWSCSSASWNGLKLVNDVGSALDSLDDGPPPTREAISECEEATEVISRDSERPCQANVVRTRGRLLGTAALDADARHSH